MFQVLKVLLHGAVKLLDNLKVVDTISFGTETSDLAALNNIANILTEEPREYSNYLKEELTRLTLY